MRRPSRAAALAAGMGTVALTLAACGTTSPTPAAPTAIVLPPAQALPGSGGTWATLAMGHVGDPLNTFGELFVRTGGAWSLVTPPGVASNGGLMVAANPDGGLTAGFGVSLDLRFSPLAETSGAGTAWSGGILPAGLVPVPDALAASGPAARLALVSTAGGTVLAAGSDIDAWSRLSGTDGVAPVATASGCAFGPLTAVAITGTGDDLVAGTCAAGGRAGVFRIGSSGHPVPVSDVGPRIPGGAGPVEVDRLVATGAGLAALVSTGTGSGTRLVTATSTDDGAAWTVSSPVATGGREVRATAVTPSGGFAVLLASGTAASGLEVGAPGGAWQSLPVPPADTSVVAALPDGRFDALVPAGVQLEVSTLEPGAGGPSAGSWVRTQTVDVPLQYGSSG